MITNIVDHSAQFFVSYYFFSTTYHKVLFYYNDKGDITTAMPSTIGDTGDPSFNQFLTLLTESAQN